MRIDGRLRPAVGLAVLILLTAFSHPLWPQAADESGTLVMVARTSNAVIVSVDSKVTPHDSTAPLPALPATPIDGDRKLVNVGENSACALDGFLGANEGDKDVSASMRLWIAANPKTEAREAIDALLDAAAGEWDRRHFTLAQIQNQSRKIDSSITKITCGEFVDGNPIIVVGETYVKADVMWEQVAGKKIFPEEEMTVLYMGGAYQTARHFTTLIEEPTFRPQSNNPKIIDGDKAVREDIRGNKTAMASLFKWYTAPLTWTQTDVKNLFVPTFASVEKHFSEEVGCPNNVRILTACGRRETTVESDWPTCPSSSSAPKKGKKSTSNGK
jgi:hypothetical protein